MQTPLLLAVGQGEGQRGGRSVAVLADAVDDALRIEAEALAHRGEDAPVGLVIDEEIDVLQRRAGGVGDLQGGEGQARDRLAERFVALHADVAVLPPDTDAVSPRAVGPELNRSDPALRRRGGEHDRAGSVGEHDRGARVVGVDDPRHEIGADDEYPLGPAGLDLGAPDRECGEKA